MANIQNVTRFSNYVNFWRGDNRPELNVLFPDYFPYVRRECLRGDSNTMAWRCELPGLMYEIMKIIASGINHRLVIKLDDNTNVSHSRLWRLLEPGVYDTIAYPLQITESRKHLTDVTTYLYQVDSFILIRAEEKRDSWWNLFKIYDNSSWWMIFMISVLQAIFVWIVQRVELRSFLQTNVKVHEAFWQVIRVQCLQNHELHFHFKAGKFSLWLFAFLQCSILLGVFASWFLYSLIRPPNYDWLKHNRYVFSQLQSGERQLITEGSVGWFTENKAKGHTYPFLDFKTALEDKEILGKSAQEAISEVINNGAIMYTRADWLTYLYASEHCDIIKTYVAFPPLGSHLILPKNSPLTERMNKVIHANRMKFKDIYRRYTQMISKESLSDTLAICGKFHPGDPLKMSFFYGLFIVIAALFLASIIFFSGEVVYKAYHRHNIAFKIV